LRVKDQSGVFSGFFLPAFYPVGFGCVNTIGQVQ
jgi:hypothetical protein